MSRGQGPRMVVELELDLKRSLYAALAKDGLTFKAWLTREAQRYLSDRRQAILFAAEPPAPSYETGSSEGGHS